MNVRVYVCIHVCIACICMYVCTVYVHTNECEHVEGEIKQAKCCKHTYIQFVKIYILYSAIHDCFDEIITETKANNK